MKPKMRETWRNDVTIKLKTLLEVTENPRGCFSNDEKLINIHIKHGCSGWESSTSFNHTKKGKEELLKYLKEECYL